MVIIAQNDKKVKEILLVCLLFLRHVVKEFAQIFAINN